MQPSLILPIILKDLRANRWLFAAFFAATILITASSFLNPQNLGFLAYSGGMILVYLLSVLLTLLAMARVVHADPPASDTAFLATRPVSGTTLFFAKLLLIIVSLFLIPSVIEAVAMLLLGFETSVVLESILGPANWMIMMALFSICSMTKKLLWFLIWIVVYAFGISVFLSIGAVSFLGAFVFSPLYSINPNWAELAGIHWFLVSGENFENKTVLLAYATGAIAFFGIIWRQYVRPNTLRSAFLFVGAILISSLLDFVGYRQALHLPSEAKASNVSMPTGALAAKPTDLYPRETKIPSEKDGMQVNRTPNMISKFTFSNWPEDVHSMAVSNVSVSFNRDGQPVTTPILPAEGMGRVHELRSSFSIELAANSLKGLDFQAKTDLINKMEDLFKNHNFSLCFSWPPLGLENGLPSTTGDLTLRLDLVVFQYKTQAILPLQLGETAQFGRRIATVRSINPSPRLRSVTLEIDEMSVPSFSWAEPVYRLKTGAGLVKASQSERSMISSELSPVERSTVTLTFPMPSTMEQQTDAPLDEEVMSQRIAEWLKDAELVVSTIVPAGTIQREMPITGEARMRFLNGARPMAYRAGYARLVFEDLENIPDDNLEKVQILGFDGSWDQLKIHVPAARRGEFDALADNTTRFAWLAKEVQAQMEAGDKPAADSYATLLLQGWGVERNLPQAKILLQDAIKRRNFDGAQLYVQLHVDDPDQPEGVRDAMDLMIPLLEAGHTPILWSTEEAMPILAKRQEESDRALGLQLARSVAQNVKQVYSNQNDESWTKNPNVKDNAKIALDRLIDSGSPQDLALAEQLVKAWLARDPQSKEAKEYQTKLPSR